VRGFERGKALRRVIHVFDIDVLESQRKLGVERHYS